MTGSLSLVRWAGLCLALLAARPCGAAGETWTDALAAMPLPPQTRVLARTNCVEVMLAAFQSNATVRALIFMPGATDEFYMFRRARAQLEAPNPSLLDAVRALTNQTLIRATFQPPFLLLHSDEDPLEPLVEIEDLATAARFQSRPFLPHVTYVDRDWDTLQPHFRKKLRADVRPLKNSYDSWHFYRHSFSAWNLNGLEALKAAALAGKSRFKVQPSRVIFECDKRVRATPRLDSFPKD